MRAVARVRRCRRIVVKAAARRADMGSDFCVCGNGKSMGLTYERSVQIRKFQDTD
jgi:hypothetical protein